jgi:putative phosphoesterase
MQIGILSDTHGVLHPAVRTHFAGVEHILHAGDIGDQKVIAQLESLAPVSAVTGNVDWGSPLDRRYPRVRSLHLAGCCIYVTHIGAQPEKLVQRLPNPRPDVYIFGHSHVALIECRDDVLFLNPGAAGRPRFGRRPSVALLTITMGMPTAEIVWL